MDIDSMATENSALRSTTNSSSNETTKGSDPSISPVLHLNEMQEDELLHLMRKARQAYTRLKRKKLKEAPRKQRAKPVEGTVSTQRPTSDSETASYEFHRNRDTGRVRSNKRREKLAAKKFRREAKRAARFEDARKAGLYSSEAMGANAPFLSRAQNDNDVRMKSQSEEDGLKDANPVEESTFCSNEYILEASMNQMDLDGCSSLVTSSEN